MRRQPSRPEPRPRARRTELATTPERLTPEGRRAHARARGRSRLRRLVAVPALALVVALVLLFQPGSAKRVVAKQRGVVHAALSAADPATAESATGVALDPSLFTPGSCVAFAPTAGDAHKTVFLDAGHGGPDPGAVGVTTAGTTIHEADETLPVVLRAATLLRADGYRVVLSRTRASAVARPLPGDMDGKVFTVKGELREIASRDVCANLAKATILVAVYFDAGGSPQNAGSVTAYDRARPFWRANLRLATLVQRDVVGAMNARGWDIPNDGVVSDVSLGGPPLSAAGGAYGHLLVIGPPMAGYFTTPSTMPGALIEPLFITDPFEGSIAASATGQEVIAQGLAKAVQQYFASS